jgi:hypothetical protein
LEPSPWVSFSHKKKKIKRKAVGVVLKKCQEGQLVAAYFLKWSIALASASSDAHSLFY